MQHRQALVADAPGHRHSPVRHAVACRSPCGSFRGQTVRRRWSHGATRDRAVHEPGRSPEHVEVAEDDPQDDEDEDGAEEATAELPGSHTRDCTAKKFAHGSSRFACMVLTRQRSKCDSRSAAPQTVAAAHFETMLHRGGELTAGARAATARTASRAPNRRRGPAARAPRRARESPGATSAAAQQVVPSARQGHAEADARGVALGDDRASVGAHDLIGDVEPEAEPAGGGLRRRLAATERIEERR